MSNGLDVARAVFPLRAAVAHFKNLRHPAGAEGGGLDGSGQLPDLPAPRP